MSKEMLDKAIAYEDALVEKYERAMNFEPADNIDDDIKMGAINCFQKHKQYAEWLKELKAYKENEFNVLAKDGQSLYQMGVLDGYKRGINNFKELAMDTCRNHGTGVAHDDSREPLYAHEDGTWHSLLDDVAAQLTLADSKTERSEV